MTSPNGACRHHNVNGTCKFSQPTNPTKSEVLFQDGGRMEVLQLPGWLLCHHVEGRFCETHERLEAKA